MKLFAMLIAVIFLSAGLSGCAEETRAADARTGKLTCAKCELKETPACQNVLQVQESGATVNYYLADNKVSTDYHSNVCEAPKENVTVMGVVQEQGGKKVIVASKIEAK